MNNRFFTVCGAVFIEEKIMLVRHTYGAAKDRILLPGGYVREGEMPENACVREIFEETGVTVRVKSLLSMQFKPQQWCAYFLTEYISGTPRSDNHENSEIVLLSPEDALLRSDITNTSRTVIKMLTLKDHKTFSKNDFHPSDTTSEEYSLYGGTEH